MRLALRSTAQEMTEGEGHVAASWKGRSKDLSRMHGNGHVRFSRGRGRGNVALLPDRGLRPAVIARKVSQCSKNERGAEAFGAFTSVIRTVLRRCPADPVAALVELFRTGVLPKPASATTR